ncbi:type ISP restriction/modification enzyme [Fibrobacter sp. UWEL]|uniref:type ISP restriction/modification enzyme n=1 Tax=Fibrobacter sp. UWEL TaxID=1896209 RepID=UPI00091BD11D|nr:type ISP restriction/modification enzyme [Fibrobacter sp. UWEL]SHK75004.1 N-6 DNA Methylase [Fibrobacter sp. UWEL]
MSGIDANKKKAVESYVAEVGQHFSAGIATEHSYRPALTDLLKALLPKFIVMNEPARIECGAPDLILARDANGIPVSVAFVEAKDVGDSDLDGNRQHKEQFNRYKKSLDHILFTDYLDFHLYEGETFVDSVRIAEIKGNKIAVAEDNILKFLEMVESLAGATPQKITSPKKMAEMMANKARLLADVVERTLAADTEKTGELAGQWKSFKTTLIHDLTERQFADIYAQTICYGMFAARLHDETPDTFSRDEAANLIPKTNPFLRKIFQSIAGYDVSESIVWIVDDLIESFRVTDIHKVMANFGKSTAQTDSMIHFYEDFLRCYDPKQKKACGVYYTPEPVVKFIVNAVDEILQKDFNMPMGLADTSKVQLDRIVDGTSDKKSKDHKVHEMREYHKVQILDPATGTGTFLAEAVRKIHSKMEGQQGAWQSYVEEHLLPRLNGFEFMMAPYAVAHLKLDMVLGETGYKAAKDKRLRIFLTNSLEECDPDTGTLFAQWLAQEANEANYIKRDTPVMVMIGNPPYSVSSSNKGEWIERLLEDYKKDLNERNIQPLSDDYIKFIRLAHYYVEKNGEGILAYISNNSFIDGIIHRQMRKELMNAFDSIYILDLHGNTRKKEVSPDGSKDENVFDIMQGVSINIFVKTKNNNSTRHSEQKASNPSCHSERSASTPARHSERSVSEVEESSNLANVYHFELFGKREDKYEYLRKHSFNDVPWTKLNPQEPQNFFVPKDENIQLEYDGHIPIQKLLNINVNGIKTQCDGASIAFSAKERNELKQDFISLSEDEIHRKYGFNNVRDWQIPLAKKDISENKIKAEILCYRPFDFRHMIFTGKTKGIMGYPRDKFMQNFYLGNNIGLILGRQGQAVGSMQWNLAYCSKHIVDTNIYYRGGGIVFPLYLYPTDEEAALGETRKPNLDEEIWRKIDKCIQIPDHPRQARTGVGNDNSKEHITTPEQIFDYIYGILHTPSYREKYKEFLKVDFPRIPYPENTEKFNQILELGNKLRQLHLMEENPQSTVTFNIPGNNLISEIKYQDNCVYINKEQYFDNIPELAWNFYIGGYQPAQKWLKDRKGRTLSFDDIAHYRNIIAILLETDKLMQQLDQIN